MRWPRRGILIRLFIYVPLIAILAWRARGGCGDEATMEPEDDLEQKLAPHRRVITLPDGTQQQIVELTPEEAEAILGHSIPSLDEGEGASAPPSTVEGAGAEAGEGQEAGARAEAGAEASARAGAGAEAGASKAGEGEEAGARAGAGAEAGARKAGEGEEAGVRAEAGAEAGASKVGVAGPD